VLDEHTAARVPEPAEDERVVLAQERLRDGRRQLRRLEQHADDVHARPVAERDDVDADPLTSRTGLAAPHGLVAGHAVERRGERAGTVPVVPVKRERSALMRRPS
jgi:hypothetical protein